MVITAGAAEYGSRHQRRQSTAAEEEEDRDDFMAAMMVPQTSKGILPNFSTLPCFNVQWGRRVHLRCVKEDDGVDHHESPPSSTFHRRSSVTRSEFNSEQRKRRSADDGGIEAMREKLMLDFRAEVHQMQAALLKKSDVVASTTVPQLPAVEPRPWNLRTRRAVCKEPNNFPAPNDRKPSYSPARQSEVKSPAKKNSGEVGGGDGGERPRAKFSGSLSKQEIEEDFLSILGTRPARRPKKRPKYVQRQIDAVFPGYWLSEISTDMYKVNEQPKAGNLAGNLKW